MLVSSQQTNPGGMSTDTAQHLKPHYLNLIIRTRAREIPPIQRASCGLSGANRHPYS